MKAPGLLAIIETGAYAGRDTNPKGVLSMARKATAAKSLSPEFDALWPSFEGQTVGKVILTFAGEVDLSANVDVCQSIEYLGDIAFTIHGRVTGKKFSEKQGLTLGTATLTVDRVELAGQELLTRVGTRAAAKAAKADSDDAIFDPDFNPDVMAPEGSEERVRGLSVVN